GVPRRRPRPPERGPSEDPGDGAQGLDAEAESPVRQHEREQGGDGDDEQTDADEQLPRAPSTLEHGEDGAGGPASDEAGEQADDAAEQGDDGADHVARPDHGGAERRHRGDHGRYADQTAEQETGEEPAARHGEGDETGGVEGLVPADAAERGEQPADDEARPEHGDPGAGVVHRERAQVGEPDDDQREEEDPAEHGRDEPEDLADAATELVAQEGELEPD